MSPSAEDPTLRNARREAVIIALIWLGATAYCCISSYFNGYIRPGNPLGPDDVRPVLGMPSWFFWGVIAPWGVCGLITIWFAGFHMAEDDLGSDHARDLDEEIREAALDGSG